MDEILYPFHVIFYANLHHVCKSEDAFRLPQNLFARKTQAYICLLYQ